MEDFDRNTVSQEPRPEFSVHSEEVSSFPGHHPQEAAAGSDMYIRSPT